MSELRIIKGTPSAAPMMVKAVLPTLPGVSALPGVRRSGGELPDLELVHREVHVEQSHVHAYADVCRYPRKDTLPLTYLHMLAFPLHMSLMTDSSFPFPAMGLVHLENSITQHRTVTHRELFDVSVSAQNLRPHTKGKAFDMVTEIRVGDETVWEEVSTYLRRGKGDASAPAGMSIEPAPGQGVTWRLPGDQGRKYASVSGDYNPIHLYAATAKALGFPRQIVHGMWSKARCVAALENRIPDAVKVETVFKTPVLLPSSVIFRTRPAEGDEPLGFSMVNPENDAPHLHGRVLPLQVPVND
jgi:acyl dehydratase